MSINTPAELEAKLIELSPILHEKFNVSKIGYFGSFARNQQTDDSDIDILVEAADSNNLYILPDELSAIFGREVDVVEKDRILAELRESILEDVRYIDGNIVVGASFPQPGDTRYMKKKRYDIYLRDILNGLRKIETKTAGLDFESFVANEDVYVFVERFFITVGEAAGKVPQEIREKYPTVAWTSMIGLRNVVVHDYDGIDYAKMWDTIKNNIPQDIIEMERIVEAEKITINKVT
jgi:uncharacterized protein with HEPN domain/predicted nucleotidyltransferase